MQLIMPDIGPIIWFVVVFAITITLELTRRFSKDDYNWVFKSILISGVTVMASLGLLLACLLYLPWNAVALTIVMFGTPGLIYFALRKSIP